MCNGSGMRGKSTTFGSGNRGIVSGSIIGNLSGQPWLLRQPPRPSARAAATVEHEGMRADFVPGAARRPHAAARAGHRDVLDPTAVLAHEVIVRRRCGIVAHDA